MKKENFYDLIMDEILPNCIQILKTKGESYTLTDDRLIGFKKNAKLSGTTPLKLWLIFFAKHFDSITSYINENYSDSEPIETRIYDMINYLFLLYGLIYEQKTNQRIKKIM